MNASEIFSKLQSSLSTVSSAKGALETAQINLNSATKVYQDALAETTNLRAELDAALNTQMGTTSDERVRIS